MQKGHEDVNKETKMLHKLKERPRAIGQKRRVSEERERDKTQDTVEKVARSGKM